ncbi:MAG: DUF262 domain-containing protein [Cyclobacteriaceae bacterium]|nr:DUF262 domain-containing protein [Cyclobacteriaceae bacterium]
MAKKKLTDKEIEELYESGIFKLTQERNDFLLPQILDFVNTKKWINLHPEYQRRLVWDRQKKSLFIESLIMNIPIPPIFLYEWDYSRFEVMDGQQRLSTIIEFYENRLKLSGLEQWESLNGKTFSELPPILKKAFDRRRISATVLLAESKVGERTPNELRKFVFERLNTGGQKLNAQELRNCIYSGHFNDMLIRLAGNDIFDDLWEIPRYSENIRSGQISKNLAENALFKRMTDCEIVLRYFAFKDKTKVKGSVKKILDDCMEREQNITATKANELENIFIDRLSACQAIFETYTFKLPEGKKGVKLSQPLFDAVMIAVDRLYSKKDELISHKKKIQTEFLKLLNDPNNYELVVGKPGTADAIKKRADFVFDFLKGYVN